MGHGGSVIYGHGVWYGFGGIMWILIVIVVIIAIVFLVKSVSDSSKGSKDSYVDDSYKKEDEAMGILRERFAKGEITEEEFNKMKKILEKRQ